MSKSNEHNWDSVNQFLGPSISQHKLKVFLKVQHIRGLRNWQFKGTNKYLKTESTFFRINFANSLDPWIIKRKVLL